MELSRATFYEQPDSVADDTATVEAIAVICNEFEHMAGVVFAPLFGKRHDRQSQEDSPPNARA